jgi:hypothetical protein
MYRAIEFNSEEDAMDRSCMEAMSQGIDINNPDNVTKCWWRVSQSTDDKWCCWIGTDIVEDTVVNKEIKVVEI